MEFKLHAPFKPTGDQPEAIEKLAQGVKMGLDEQVLLGVTGSGKTFTMASVIEKVQRPTLVLAHNKTLAAQLCAEFKEFFPENAVEYFVSYYDYYQPEAYIPHTDTYIAKDASTNEEIDRLRLSATCALLERRDVIVVSSVSCIYGLGEPEDFEKLMISLRPGMTMERDFLLKRLIEIRYERNDVAFERGQFATRRPLGVEVPFSMVVAGTVVRGRIDAVFAAGDDYLVVDWKTGDIARADPIQLAIYAHAWAELVGVPVQRVRAGFFDIMADRLVVPEVLPPRQQWTAAVSGLPRQ